MNAPSRDTLDSYLRQVRNGLRALPESEVSDILAELRSHVLERSAGMPGGVAQAVEALGRPEEVASQYLTEYALAVATSSRSPWLILRGLFRWATVNVAGFFVLVLSLTGYLLGLPLVVTALLKPLAPSRVGLWVDMQSTPHSFNFGFAFDTPAGQELLGWWLVPFCLVVGIAVVVVTLQFDLWCLRLYQRHLSQRRPD